MLMLLINSRAASMLLLYDSRFQTTMLRVIISLDLNCKKVFLIFLTQNFQFSCNNKEIKSFLAFSRIDRMRGKLLNGAA